MKRVPRNREAGNFRTNRCQHGRVFLSRGDARHRVGEACGTCVDRVGAQQLSSEHRKTRDVSRITGPRAGDDVVPVLHASRHGSEYETRMLPSSLRAHCRAVGTHPCHRYGRRKLHGRASTKRSDGYTSQHGWHVGQRHSGIDSDNAAAAIMDHGVASILQCVSTRADGAVDTVGNDRAAVRSNGRS
eukprot:scaffold1166_cov261-Pinguiococcus_pyrenoidosus.AAC.13